MIWKLEAYSQLIEIDQMIGMQMQFGRFTWKTSIIIIHDWQWWPFLKLGMPNLVFDDMENIKFSWDSMCEQASVDVAIGGCSLCIL